MVIMCLLCNAAILYVALHADTGGARTNSVVVYYGESLVFVYKTRSRTLGTLGNTDSEYTVYYTRIGTQAEYYTDGDTR